MALPPGSTYSRAQHPSTSDLDARVARGIGDKVGKERMLIVTLSALTVGSVIAAVANSSGPMIATRGAAAIVAVVVLIPRTPRRDTEERFIAESEVGMTAG